MTVRHFLGALANDNIRKDFIIASIVNPNGFVESCKDAKDCPELSGFKLGAFYRLHQQHPSYFIGTTSCGYNRIIHSILNYLSAIDIDHEHFTIVFGWALEYIHRFKWVGYHASTLALTVIRLMLLGRIDNAMIILQTIPNLFDIVSFRICYQQLCSTPNLILWHAETYSNHLHVPINQKLFVNPTPFIKGFGTIVDNPCYYILSTLLVNICAALLSDDNHIVNIIDMIAPHHSGDDDDMVEPFRQEYDTSFILVASQKVHLIWQVWKHTNYIRLSPHLTLSYKEIFHEYAYDMLIIDMIQQAFISGNTSGIIRYFVQAISVWTPYIFNKLVDVICDMFEIPDRMFDDYNIFLMMLHHANESFIDMVNQHCYELVGKLALYRRGDMISALIQSKVLSTCNITRMNLGIFVPFGYDYGMKGVSRRRERRRCRMLFNTLIDILDICDIEDLLGNQNQLARLTMDFAVTGNITKICNIDILAMYCRGPYKTINNATELMHLVYYSHADNMRTAWTIIRGVANIVSWDLSDIDPKIY